MSACWVVYLLVLMLAISAVNSWFDLDTPVRLARCRATCLYKMKTAPTSDAECDESLFCSQCWKSCGVLQTHSVVGLHCRSEECGQGCLEACKFHTLPPSVVLPPPPEDVLLVNGSRLSWPPVPGSVVYVVMTDGSPLRHTLEPRVDLPSTVDPGTVRVLVVDWRGLVRVFAPSPESPIDQAIHILRSLGLQEQLGVGVRENERYPEKSLLPKVVHHVWRLQVESVHQQPPLVTAEISWRHYHDQLLSDVISPVTSYLVKWSVDGDLVKGTLLTNSPSVALSLLPDTLYRIQVHTVGRHTSNTHSERLLLDTNNSRHKLTNVNNLSSSLLRNVTSADFGIFPPSQHYQIASAAIVIVLVFLGLAVTSVWSWRYWNAAPNKRLLYERI